MDALFGEYRHKIDAKGRIAMPADFRKVLPETLVISLAPTKDYVCVYDVAGFSAWVDSLFEKDGGFQQTNRDHIMKRKVINSGGKRVELDSAGRIGLSADLRKSASIDKDIVVIGDSDHFEIWDAKRWDEFCRSIDLSSLYD